jgi:glucose-6-phosphate-specific signal transduction histidine kinase
MQAIHLVWLCTAALAGLAVGAAVSHWFSRQKLDQLQQRLLRSEEARNGAIERSAKAREQIGQLSQAISDLRKSHQPTRGGAAAQPAVSTAEQRRAIAERALAAAAAYGSNEEEDDEAPARSGVVLFANTQPLEL